MSRIGKQLIAIPEKVKVNLDGQKILVDGPKGSLSRILPSLICCNFDEENKNLLIENLMCNVSFWQKVCLVISIAFL